MSGWCASGISLTHIALSLFSISLIGIYQILMAFEGLYQPSPPFICLSLNIDFDCCRSHSGCGNGECGLTFISAGS